MLLTVEFGILNQCFETEATQTINLASLCCVSVVGGRAQDPQTLLLSHFWLERHVDKI
jgi:hypothetical protein